MEALAGRRHTANDKTKPILAKAAASECGYEGGHAGSVTGSRNVMTSETDHSIC
jgi:hypothetical protein